MLFIHGNGVDHRFLLGLDDVFAEPGQWERIYLDLPGFGGTRALPSPGGLPELAAWLDAEVDDLVGTRPFGVVSNSLGGLLARDLVSRRRGQCLGMALLVPVVDPVREHRTVPEHQVLVRDDALMNSLDAEEIAAYAGLAVLQTRDNWERFSEAALPGIRVANVSAMARLDRNYALPAFSDDALDGFDAPVLIVTGKQDAVVGHEDQWELARRFAHSTYAVLDHAGHNVHLDAPDAVRALLARWAAQTLAPVMDNGGARP